MAIIKDVISNVKNGNVYVILKGERRKRQLHKDKYGYFVYANKKIGLVDRFTDPQDIKKIEDFLT